MAITLCVVVIFALSFHSCEGDLGFASYYGDHMVLQQSPERAVLWGYGPEGAQVTLNLSGPTKHNTLHVHVTNGIWRVTLDPVEAGGPYNVTAATKSSKAILTDVLFGDIWLCGGQSNMQLKLSQVFNATDEIKLSEKYPQVRFFMAALKLNETEQNDLIGAEIPWSVAPKNVAGFSALCWLYGRYLYETLKYPIGLVESCFGSTPVEAWSSSRALQQCGLENSGLTFPDYKRNSVLWNAMIHPLLNMTIKGAIWYQGEANAFSRQPYKYSCSFPALIDDWRRAFHEGSGGQTADDFPFGFVQLSTFQPHSTAENFPFLRWHQTADIGYVPNPQMPKTFMAVALDLPDPSSPFFSIHPRDKQDVAYRLTLGARAVAYNEKGVVFHGPFPKKVLSDQDYINVTYNRKISVTPSQNIFEISCSGSPTKSGWLPAPIWQWNQNSVQLKTGLCQPPSEVVALRYAWRDWPCKFKACPIYSANRVLPAPPFIVTLKGKERSKERKNSKKTK